MLHFLITIIIYSSRWRWGQFPEQFLTSLTFRGFWSKVFWDSEFINFIIRVTKCQMSDKIKRWSIYPKITLLASMDASRGRPGSACAEPTLIFKKVVSVFQVGTQKIWPKRVWEKIERLIIDSDNILDFKNSKRKIPTAKGPSWYLNFFFRLYPAKFFWIPRKLFLVI